MIWLQKNSLGKWNAYFKGNISGSPQESEIEEWFLDNFKKLGFSNIEPSQGIGDFISWRFKRKFIIELEQTTSQFFLHKKEVRDKIQIIICWRKCDPQEIGNCSPQGIEALNKLLELYHKEIIEIKDFLEYVNLYNVDQAKADIHKIADMLE